MNKLAIERNHQALKRLLALLFVYIGLADDTGGALRSFNSMRAGCEPGSVHGDGQSVGLARALQALTDPMTVSRRLHRMIWKLLRPVESATRYLIVDSPARCRRQSSSRPRRNSPPRRPMLPLRNRLE